MPSNPSQSEPELLTSDDFLTVVEQNRVRVRTLSGFLLTVSGFLFSAIFVIGFFLVEKGPQPAGSVYVSLLIALVQLFLSMLLSVQSAALPLPSAVVTKLQLVDTVTHLYHRERNYVKWSTNLLFASLIAFCAALGFFAHHSLPRSNVTPLSVDTPTAKPSVRVPAIGEKD